MNKELLIKTAIEVKKIAEREYIERDVDMSQCVAFAQRNESIAFERMMFIHIKMNAVIARIEQSA